MNQANLVIDCTPYGVYNLWANHVGQSHVEKMHGPGKNGQVGTIWSERMVQPDHF